MMMISSPFVASLTSSGAAGFRFCQRDFLHFQFLNVCRFVEVRINIAR